MALNALQALKHSGIVISSDTPEYLRIGEFYPQDATTNPSLVFAAVTKPQYRHLVEESIQHAVSKRTSLEEQTELACDYLLVRVGTEILKIIPGRVSVSVDPRLADDHDAIVQKGRNLISIFEELGCPRERVLVKIPATYTGILACKTLETPLQSPNGSPTKPIHTNATLIFSLAQALACAQAGISVISPFIGRVKDWFNVHYTKLHNGDAPPVLPLSQHPGILLVRDIRAAFTSYEHTTAVMAAGFRTADEIVELGRYGVKGGPDFVTTPPELLDDLRKRIGTVGSSPPPENDAGKVPEPRYIAIGEESQASAEARYTADIERERVAVDKVPEGLAKFSVDAKGLEDFLREKIRSRTQA